LQFSGPLPALLLDEFAFAPFKCDQFLLSRLNPPQFAL